MNLIMVLFLFTLGSYAHARDNKCSGDKCCAHWTADKKCMHEYVCTECSFKATPVGSLPEEKKCTKDGKCCAHWTAAGECAHEFTCTDCP